MRFSPIEHSIFHILGMVGPVDAKQRKWHWLVDLWPLIFKVKIISLEWDFKAKSGICYISAQNGSIAMKQKANISFEY